MRHIDEGTLHAYLDGAIDALLAAGALPSGTTRATIETHLAECADCRSLLEAERELRVRAGDILADAGAHRIDVPPFSSVQAIEHRKPRRFVPLAWAASVILALGAGWWGSALFRETQLSTALQDEAAPVTTRAERLEERARVPAADALRSDAPPAAAAPPAVSVDAMSARGQGAAVSNEAVVMEQAQERDGWARAPARDLREAERLQQNLAANDSGRLGAIAGAGRDTTPLATPPFGRQNVMLDAVIVTGAAAQGGAFAPAAPPAADSPQLQRFRAGLDSLDAGRVRLERTTPAAASAPLLAVEAADTPVVQRGNILGAGLTRLTQRVDNVHVEVVAWREAMSFADAARLQLLPGPPQQQLQLQAQTEARRMETSAQQKTLARQLRYTVLGSTRLPDGRQQVLLHWTEGSALIAVRADATGEQLLALVNRLAPLRREE